MKQLVILYVLVTMGLASCKKEEANDLLPADKQETAAEESTSGKGSLLFEQKNIQFKHKGTVTRLGRNKSFFVITANERGYQLTVIFSDSVCPGKSSSYTVVDSMSKFYEGKKVAVSIRDNKGNTYVSVYGTMEMDMANSYATLYFKDMVMYNIKTGKASQAFLSILYSRKKKEGFPVFPFNTSVTD